MTTAPHSPSAAPVRRARRALVSASLVLAAAACAAQPGAEPARSSRSVAKQDTGGDAETATARTACTETYECTLVDRDPCACGLRRARDVEAIASAWNTEHPSSPSGSCPDCLSEPNPDLLATCRGGRCRVLDVSTSSMSRCTTAADCIAIDTGCCPPCGPHWHWVAVGRARASRLRSQLCGADWATVACPACASPVAPTPVVSCEAGHCRVDRDR